MGSTKTIRLVSLRGDVEEIVKLAKDLFSNIHGGLYCKYAEIKHDLGNISTDRDKLEYYPLRIHAENDIVILVSEVRCGYHGRSCDAMIEILELAGFHPNTKVKEKIYNSPKLSMTIWNERLMQQY